MELKRARKGAEWTCTLLVSAGRGGAFSLASHTLKHTIDQSLSKAHTPLATQDVNNSDPRPSVEDLCRF